MWYWCLCELFIELNSIPIENLSWLTRRDFHDRLRAQTTTNWKYDGNGRLTTWSEVTWRRSICNRYPQKNTARDLVLRLIDKSSIVEKAVHLMNFFHWLWAIKRIPATWSERHCEKDNSISHEHVVDIGRLIASVSTSDSQLNEMMSFQDGIETAS